MVMSGVKTAQGYITGDPRSPIYQGTHRYVFTLAALDIATLK
jgi:hypothetical protein